MLTFKINVFMTCLWWGHISYTLLCDLLPGIILSCNRNIDKCYLLEWFNPDEQCVLNTQPCLHSAVGYLNLFGTLNITLLFDGVTVMASLSAYSITEPLGLTLGSQCALETV